MMTDYNGRAVPFDPEDLEGPDLPDLSTLGTNPGSRMFKARNALRGSLETLTEARDTLRVDLQTAVRRWKEQQEVSAALQAINPAGDRGQRLVDASDARTAIGNAS
ncbi:hypothetical protein [Clavibacter nebraskensis]|uniref:hypothetical protein n=1 Tax=Clavibacter nebraskensis TaxID=31963 RepID=UPI003F86A8C5